MIYQLITKRPTQFWVGLFLTLNSHLGFTQSSITLSEGTVVSITVVPAQVTNPWEIIPIADNLVWVTERPLAQVSEINLTTGEKRTILTIPEEDFIDACCLGVAGILGMALHPDYHDGTQEVFISYTNSNFAQTLVKYEYNGTSLVNPEILLDVGESADNNGSRLLIAHDRTLLMSIGSGDDERAQSLSSLIGKWVRINLDGSAPVDNPFYDAENPEAPQNYIYSLGHRNPQGVTQIPSDDAQYPNYIYAAEHGDQQNDEVNRIVSGDNYGWADFEGWTEEATESNHPPLVTFDLAPTDIQWYEHPAIPEWNRKLLMGTSKGQQLVAWSLTSDGLDINERNPDGAPSNNASLTDIESTITIYIGDDTTRPRCITPLSDGRILIGAYVNEVTDRILILENEAYEAPAVTWSPSTLNFGSVEGGIYTATAQLTNETDEPISIDAITVSPNNNTFSLISPNEFPTSVDANQSIDISVRFEAYSGTSYAANLIAETDVDDFVLNLTASIPNPDAGNTIELESTTLTIRTITESLVRPWEIELGPDGDLWVTERNDGNVVIVDPNDGTSQVVFTMPDEDMPPADGSNGGLLGMALHPDFTGGHPWIYLAHTDNNWHQAISRYTWDGSGLVSGQRLLTVEEDAGLYGSRVRFLPDGTLLWSTGSGDESAQSTSSLAGKILRLNDDGSVPSDNPFANSEDENERYIFTIGHRNPQGITVIPASELLQNPEYIISEHGATANDEINALLAGDNYGWDTFEGWLSESSPSNHTPKVTFDEAPMGIDYYNHPAIPEWEHSLLTGTSKGEMLLMLSLDDELNIVDHNPLAASSNTLTLNDNNQFRFFNDGQTDRIRDVQVGPNGEIYLATFNLNADRNDRLLVLENLAYNPQTVVDPDPNEVVTHEQQDEMNDPSDQVLSTSPELVLTEVYPNPVEETLNLLLVHDSDITLSGLAGQIIFKKKLLSGHSQLPTKDLNEGMYFLKIRSVKGTELFKIIK